MLDYIRDVSYITAGRVGWHWHDYKGLMLRLKEELENEGLKPTLMHYKRDGWHGMIYMVPIVPDDLKFMLKISREYSQDTLIFFGRLYDVSTGRMIGVFTRATFYTEKPDVPTWIEINQPFHRPYYLVLS
jgi:hypothetical protein